MNNEPVAWMAVNELNGSYSTFTNDQKQRLLPHISQCYGKWIPLYTQQRPHNTALVPCDKLAEMQAEIEALKAKLAYMFEQEINSVAFEMVNKAILRKAQE